MDKRKSQIALALVKLRLRQKASFRDIANLKEEVGSLIEEPEMVAINMGAKELLNFLKRLLQDIFEEQMKIIDSKKESSKSKHDLTAEQMKRMVYKKLAKTNPELVEKRLKERKQEFYEAVLKSLPEAEARKYADAAFWWVEDKSEEKQKERM